MFSANTIAGRRAIRRVLGFEGDGDDDPALEAGAPQFRELVTQEQSEIRRVVRQRTVAEWLADFCTAGAPVAPALLLEEVADDDHARHYFQNLVHPATGAEKQVKPIVSMSKTPTRIRATADMLGEHKDELRGEFGFEPREIDALRDAGVFGRPASRPAESVRESG